MVRPIAQRVVVFALAGLSVAAAPADDDLTVLDAADDPKRMMARYLRGLADSAFERRRAQYEALESPEQIAAYQAARRRFMIERLGGLPARTPLNARVVGKLAGDGFRVEKLIYESRPTHHVTAVLYLPTSPPLYPAVLVPCGHTAVGKASAGVQKLCILMARNGMAALCYDPIGQGERYQLLDPAGRPRFKSTTEHTLVGVGSILVGRNTASYRIWDGVRSLDYLISRDDIDASRLGCTGTSGGGTLTEYLMAIDERITAAAPMCCVTTFEKRIVTIGPGDGEQNIYGQIAFGLDHGDYTLMRAPRPTLLCTATRDFVNIQGSWDIFREAKRLYTRIGHSERVSLVEVDAKHGLPRGLRVAATRWMRRWLLDVDDAVTEPDDVPLFSVKALQCTPRGPVMLLQGAKSVMDLNREAAARLKADRPTLTRRMLLEGRSAAFMTLANGGGPARKREALIAPPINRGRVARDGFRIDKLVLRPERGISLPALLFVPVKPTGHRYLYLHEEGNHVDAGPTGPISALVRQGHLVLAVDLRGIGETAGSGRNMWGGSFDEFFLSYLLERPMLGMRALDVVAAIEFLSAYGAGSSRKPVHVVAVGSVGPPALHAAVAKRDLVASLKLVRSLRSWRDVLHMDVPHGQLVQAVHGGLRDYDLPDLVGLLPDGSVTQIDPVTAD